MVQPRHQRVERFDESPPVDVFGYQRPEWHEHAACRGRLVVMFPTTRADTAEALAICGSCPALLPCRRYAITSTDDPAGAVLGGMTTSAIRAARRVRKSNQQQQPEEDTHGNPTP